jgi:hypothetical protein
MSDRASTIGELFGMLGHHGRWWIMPAFVLVVVLGIVLAALQAIPYVAPFIYTVF